MSALSAGIGPWRTPRTPPIGDTRSASAAVPDRGHPEDGPGRTGLVDEPGGDPGGDGRADPPGRPDRRAAAPGRRATARPWRSRPSRVPPVRRTGGRTPPKQTRPAAHRKTRLAAALGSEAFEPIRVALAEGRLLVDQAQVIVDRGRRRCPPTSTTGGRGGCAGDAGRVRRPPRRPGAADPREPDPGGGRPGGRRGPRSPAPRTGGAGGGGGRVVPDGRGRAREVPRPVHDLLPARGDAQQAAARDRGTETPGTAWTGRHPNPDARRHTGWGRRSRSTSRPTPPTDSRMTGGVSATVVVTMTVDTLMGGLKAAQLDTGHRISPGLARRLACRAGIIPAVLGAELPGPRPGSEDPVPHRTPTDRPRPRAARLHRGGL